MYDFSDILQADPAVADAISQEIERQKNNIELIASENFVSKAVMAAMGSPLTTNMPRATLAGDIMAVAKRLILLKI